MFHPTPAAYPECRSAVLQPSQVLSVSWNTDALSQLVLVHRTTLMLCVTHASLKEHWGEECICLFVCLLFLHIFCQRLKVTCSNCSTAIKKWSLCLIVLNVALETAQQTIKSLVQTGTSAHLAKDKVCTGGVVYNTQFLFHLQAKVATNQFEQHINKQITLIGMTCIVMAHICWCMKLIPRKKITVSTQHCKCANLQQSVFLFHRRFLHWHLISMTNV